MPRLRNSKHEAFAQAVAADTDLADAYEQVGFVRRRGNPNRLARHPKVAARIAELQSLVFPADIENLAYIQAKALAVAGQILDAAGNRDMTLRLANDFRHISTALEQQAGKVGSTVPIVQTNPDVGRPTAAPSSIAGPTYRGVPERVASS
jgi:hypothetical protein